MPTTVLLSTLLNKGHATSCVCIERRYWMEIVCCRIVQYESNSYWDVSPLPVNISSQKVFGNTDWKWQKVIMNMTQRRESCKEPCRSDAWKLQQALFLLLHIWAPHYIQICDPRHPVKEMYFSCLYLSLSFQSLLKAHDLNWHLVNQALPPQALLPLDPEAPVWLELLIYLSKSCLILTSLRNLTTGWLNSFT